MYVGRVGARREDVRAQQVDRTREAAIGIKERKWRYFNAVISPATCVDFQSLFERERAAIAFPFLQIR
ncbi:hypothetical protein D3C84_1111260 [compost metagenome]